MAAGARGASDLWRVQEVFTDVTGSIQYIELTTTEPNEFLVTNHALTVTSDGTPATVVLNHNLAGQPTTANRTFLAATSGFAALAGSVTPDFTIPSNFIKPGANWISIDFAGIDSLSFGGSILPKNGLYSLVDHNTAGVAHVFAEINSPTNFAGALGFINAGTLPQPADFDENGTVNVTDFGWWQIGYGTETGASHIIGDANADGAVDGDDLLVWQRQLEQTIEAVPSSMAVPEPTAAVILAALLLASAGLRGRR